jgi:hypothetical protein
MVRLYCPECHRFAQFGRAGLLARFGAEIAMPDLLGRLRPCGRRSVEISRQPCQLAYWDCMSALRRREALAKGGLPGGWTAD